VRGAIEAEPDCDDDTFAARLAGDSGLRDRLVEEVIVAESWFFRDPQVFELLRRQAIARADYHRVAQQERVLEPLTERVRRRVVRSVLHAAPARCRCRCRHARLGEQRVLG
jgi:hypothetical protein